MELSAARTAFLTALATALGIAAGFAGGTLTLAVIVIALAITTALILHLYPFKPWTLLRLRFFQSAWPILLFAGLGLLSENLNRADRLMQPPPEGTTAFATVERVHNGAEGDRLQLCISSLHLPGESSPRVYRALRCMAYCGGEAVLNGIRPGDGITFAGKFSDVGPGDGYDAYLRRHGVSLTAEVDVQPKLVSSGHGLSAWAADARDRLEETIEKSPLKKATRHFLITILLGDRDFLSQDTRSLFADAGVAHILAVSGMHVAIISGILLAILFPFNFSGRWKWRWIASIPLIWLFTLITGLSPSAVRSATMLSVCFMAMTLERQRSPLHALLIAATVIMLADPRALTDAGFQLSFVCVGAIILFVERMNSVDQHAHHRLYHVNGTLLTTLVCTAASWALVAHHFGRVPVMILPANIIALPLLPLYLSLSIAYLLIQALTGWNPELLRLIVDGGYDALHSLAQWTASLPGVAVDLGVTAAGAAAWIAVICFAAYALHRGKRRLRASALLACGGFAVIIAGAGLSKADAATSAEIPPSFPEIQLKITAGPRTETLRCRRYHNSIHRSGAHTLFVADDTLRTNLPSLRPTHILICSGYPGSLRDLRRKYPDPGIKFILHSTLRRSREEALKEEASKLGLSIHSIRADGNFHLH